MAFTSLTVRFQSAGMIPPPYTHFYTLTARPSGNQLAVDFSITYTDREELDEEDITGEGFTLTDDFAWQGELPSVWLTLLTEQLRWLQLQPFNEASLGEADDYLEVTLLSGEAKTTGTPVEADSFMYTMQELVQAIFEAGEKEKPLHLTYLSYTRHGDLEVRLDASFASRSVTATRYQEGRETVKTLPWDTLESTMAAIYAYDYNPDDSLPRPPKRDGQYLNLGGDEWYDVSSLRAVQEVLEAL